MGPTGKRSPMISSPGRSGSPTCSIPRKGERATGDAAKGTALHNYRRAKGMCFKCGERWGHDHTCPSMVKLHVLEELIDLFSLDMSQNSEDSEIRQSDDSSAEQVWPLSVYAASSTEAPNCLQIHRWLQGQEVLMLVDSRSSASFVS